MGVGPPLHPQNPIGSGGSIVLSDLLDSWGKGIRLGAFARDRVSPSEAALLERINGALGLPTRSR